MSLMNVVVCLCCVVSSEQHVLVNGDVRHDDDDDSIVSVSSVPRLPAAKEACQPTAPPRGSVSSSSSLASSVL